MSIWKDGIERIDGLTRQQASIRIGKQERHQERRQKRLRDRHAAGFHSDNALKCDLCLLERRA